MAKYFRFLYLLGFSFILSTPYTGGSDPNDVCSYGECGDDRPELFPPESIYAYPPDKMGFDEIYIINLERRPERKERLNQIFKQMRLNVTFWKATDGTKLSQSHLDDTGLRVLPGYRDPYLNRPMTFGEVGCLLSHYYIWKDIQEKGHKKALILEDDATFKSGFTQKWSRMYAEVDEFVPNWELIYLGRKILRGNIERPVEGSSYLIWPNYSYWTVAYAITDKGVKKLIDQKPLRKMVPADELLSIMFDRNPNGEDLWNKYFFPKNLLAVSINPVIIEPTWFPGKSGYQTDTENTEIIGSDDEIDTKREESDLV